MSFFRPVTAAMAALLAAAVVAPPAMAQGNSASPRAGYVAVSYCNKTSGNIYVSLMYREAPGSERWVVEGWKQIGGNSCITLSLPNDGMIYD